MTTLSHLKDLQPNVQSVALVGSFFQRWALMESRLNMLIGSLLNLSPLPTAILSKNVQLRDKLSICKTFVDLYLRGDKAQEYKKVFEQIATLSSERNMLAHDSFFPDTTGEYVEFFVIKAKGKFDVPDVRWSLADFENRIDLMLDLSAKIDVIKKALESHRTPLGQSTLVTTNALYAPTGLGLLSPPPQEHPHSGLANPTSSDEIAASLDQKE